MYCKFPETVLMKVNVLVLHLDYKYRPYEGFITVLMEYATLNVCNITYVCSTTVGHGKCHREDVYKCFSFLQSLSCE